MSSYLDSSLLTSLYAPDAHSASAREYLLQAAGPFLLTPFGEAELTNAIELRVFRREITAAQARAALERLAAHIADAVFHAAPVPAAVYDVARQLSRRHTARWARARWTFCTWPPPWYCTRIRSTPLTAPRPNWPARPAWQRRFAVAPLQSGDRLEFRPGAAGKNVRPSPSQPESVVVA